VGRPQLVGSLRRRHQLVGRGVEPGPVERGWLDLPRLGESPLVRKLVESSALVRRRLGRRSLVAGAVERRGVATRTVVRQRLELSVGAAAAAQTAMTR
jgi:hypothetical protein